MSIDDADKDSSTALVFAVLAGKDDSIRVLRQHSANPRIVQPDGSTPLSLARQQDHQKVPGVLEEWLQR